MGFSIEQKKAIAVIKNYLNVEDNPVWTNEYILNEYDFVVDQIIENATNIKNVKKVGVTSISEGKQSMSFEGGTEAWTITADVKAMLPKPYIKLFY